MDTLELLLHPVRIRILHAFSAGRTRTTSDLCARLTDVSQATVYRHVALLTEHGVLRVIDEQPVGGAVERHFELDRNLATVDTVTARTMSPADHRRAFAAAMAALLADFGAFLDSGDPTVSAALIAYRQIPLWLSPDEVHALVAEVQAPITDALANEPASTRTQYLLSPILFPVAETPPAAE
jgi:DNA-binding transcriptional ArsR family regulator